MELTMLVPTVLACLAVGYFVTDEAIPRGRKSVLGFGVLSAIFMGTVVGYLGWLSAQFRAPSMVGMYETLGMLVGVAATMVFPVEQLIRGEQRALRIKQDSLRIRELAPRIMDVLDRDHDGLVREADLLWSLCSPDFDLQQIALLRTVYKRLSVIGHVFETHFGYWTQSGFSFDSASAQPFPSVYHEYAISAEDFERYPDVVQKRYAHWLPAAGS